jgi:hypothetical protein
MRIYSKPRFVRVNEFSSLVVRSSNRTSPTTAKVFKLPYSFRDLRNKVTYELLKKSDPRTHEVVLRAVNFRNILALKELPGSPFEVTFENASVTVGFFTRGYDTETRRPFRPSTFSVTFRGNFTVGFRDRRFVRFDEHEYPMDEITLTVVATKEGVRFVR